MVPFLLLGVIWAAVLLPPWLQGRREARPTASIVNFRRQLWSLARTSPAYATGTPAYGDVYTDDDADAHDAGVGDLGDEPAVAATLIRGRLANRDELARVRPAPDGEPVVPEHGAGRPGGSYRRRRHIVGGLAVAALATVAPAVLLGGSWWVVQGAADGLLVAYVGLLIQRQRRLAEREQKVRYLTPIRAPRPAVVVLGRAGAR